MICLIKNLIIISWFSVIGNGSVYIVYWSEFPLLWRPSRVLWRIWLCTHFLLCKYTLITTSSYIWVHGYDEDKSLIFFLWIYNDIAYMQLPSIMWLIIKKPKRFSITWLVNWVNIYIYIFFIRMHNLLKMSNVYISWSIYLFFCIGQISIIVGVFIMLASTIGGLRNIIADSSAYRFYA